MTEAEACNRLTACQPNEHHGMKGRVVTAQTPSIFSDISWRVSWKAGEDRYRWPYFNICTRSEHGDAGFGVELTARMDPLLGGSAPARRVEAAVSDTRHDTNPPSSYRRPKGLLIFWLSIDLFSSRPFGYAAAGVAVQCQPVDSLRGGLFVLTSCAGFPLSLSSSRNPRVPRHGALLLHRANSSATSASTAPGHRRDRCPRTPQAG